jgi:hypothetical protein
MDQIMAINHATLIEIKRLNEICDDGTKNAAIQIMSTFLFYMKKLARRHN